MLVHPSITCMVDAAAVEQIMPGSLVEVANGFHGTAQRCCSGSAASTTQKLWDRPCVSSTKIRGVHVKSDLLGVPTACKVSSDFLCC